MNGNYGALMFGDQQVGQGGHAQIPNTNGQGTVSWPPNQNAWPLLEPPSMALRAAQGLYYYRPAVPVDRARPWFVMDPNIGRQPRRIVKNFAGLTAGTESVQTIQCDIPAVAIQLTGGAFNTATNLSAGLDSFRVRFAYAQGDRLDTELALGSALLGTAAQPGYLPDTGWAFDRGTVVQIGVRPLIANLSIDVVVWWIESRGPVNFGA